MRYLLLLGLLASCANPVGNKYRMFHCGKDICQYTQSSKNPLYEEINATNDNHMDVGAYYSTIVCLVGMAINETSKEFTKNDIVDFSKKLGVGYILYEKVIDENAGEYEIKKNIVWLYVSKDKAKNCYDINEGL